LQDNLVRVQSLLQHKHRRSVYRRYMKRISGFVNHLKATIECSKDAVGLEVVLAVTVDVKDRGLCRLHTIKIKRLLLGGAKKKGGALYLGGCQTDRPVLVVVPKSNFVRMDGAMQATLQEV